MSKQWPTQTMHSWSSFLKLAEQLQAEAGLKDYLFRGQADSTWLLDPSIARIDKRMGPDVLAKREMDATKYFQAHSIELLDSRVSEEFEEVVAWWTVMQHYRAPTRLLDWTRSAYVAAYFACCSLAQADGAVWLIQRAKATERLREEGRVPKGECGEHEIRNWLNSCTNNTRGLMFIHRNKHFARSSRQRSQFSIATDPTADHAELLADVMPQDHDGKLWWKKLVIPKSEKPAFIRQLWGMNVTSATLFPDLGGLGGTVADAIWTGFQPE